MDDDHDEFRMMSEEEREFNKNAAKNNIMLGIVFAIVIIALLLGILWFVTFGMQEIFNDVIEAERE